MPKTIDIYYEPFIGGGSVLYQLINSDIKVNQFICSDINKDLINFWNHLLAKPHELIEEYRNLWEEINAIEDIEDKKLYYYSIRKRYNEHHSVHDFHFLTRTCANGLIRYNSKGEFNSPYHFSRKGIQPDRLQEIIFQWSDKLNAVNIKFIHQDYSVIQSQVNDFIYLDPPYINTSAMYFGNFNYEEFWDWLRKQQGKYALSFNGKSGVNDLTYDVPKDLYKTHTYLYSGISGFKKMHKLQEYVQESLYLSY